MHLDDKNMSAFLDHVTDILGENSLERKSSENLKSLPLNQNECIYIVDFNKNELVFNKGFFNLLGYDDNGKAKFSGKSGDRNHRYDGTPKDKWDAPKKVGRKINIKALKPKEE